MCEGVRCVREGVWGVVCGGGMWGSEMCEGGCVRGGMWGWYVGE